MSRRPNPKRLTDADRILSVSEKLRQHLITQNRLGIGMKPLAKANGIPDRTVRAIIWDSMMPPPRIVAKPSLPHEANLWGRPDLWHRYGIKGPCTPRMVSVT